MKLNNFTSRSLIALFPAVLAVLVAFNSPAVLAVVPGGTLDNSFAGNGKLATDFSGNEDVANDVAIQADGKIVVVGHGDITVGNNPIELTRYNTDGSLDTTFSSDGRASFTSSLTSFTANCVLVSPFRILVGGSGINASGYKVMVLIRFNLDGSPDTNFGTGGLVTVVFGTGPSSTYGGEIFAMTTSGSGTIAVGRTTNLVSATAITNWAMIRFDSLGGLDSGFGTAGRVTTDFGGNSLEEAQAVQVLPSGKIVVGGMGNPAGREFAVAMYTTNGALDTNFGGGDGKVTTDFSGGSDSIRDLKVLPDGKIVAAGYASVASTNQFALARYTADGVLDTTFDGDGKVTTSMAAGLNSDGNEMAVQTDGKILVAGDAGSDFGVARYNTDGSLDTTFGTGGKVVTDILTNSVDSASSIALQGDRKIVVAGSAKNSGSNNNFAVVRYFSANERPNFDYDADGLSDISVFRPSNGGWYLNRSDAGFFGMLFGNGTDRVAPADYDGDGKTDIAVYRPSQGQWYIVNSSNQSVIYYVFGLAEDLPAPADYDGDGRADICVFRPSTGTWYRQNSSNGSFFGIQFGASGDIPTIGDFDGDLKADIGIWRPSNGDWYHIRSTNGTVFGERFGLSTDKIVPADYDGDGKTDIAIWRPGTFTSLWYWKNSASGGYGSFPFGASTDIPAPGDYDGDGKSDFTVFRPSQGQWYINKSSNGANNAFPWGTSGDRPTQSVFSN